MIHGLQGNEIIIGFCSAFFMLASLFSMGKLLMSRFPALSSGGDVAIIIGLATNHMLFLACSLFFSGPVTVDILHGIHGICILLFLYFHRPVFPSIGRRYLPALILITLMLVPYFFVLLSPPMNVDGLNYYLFGAEWVYYNGLRFNSFLTGYTTMPMAGEYLFAQAFGLGGQTAIVFLDAAFSLLLIRLAYLTANRLMSQHAALAFTLAMLLIPQSTLYLFGSGKIDALNVYIIFTAISLVMTGALSANLWMILIACSLSCAVKYTSWIQLALPIMVCVIMILRYAGYRRAMIAVVLPLAFAGPVIVKNKWQVNNVRAPMVSIPEQTQYVKPHVGVTNDILDSEIKKAISKGAILRTIILKIYQNLNLMLYAILGLMLTLAYWKGIQLSRYRLPLIALLLVLLPWHAFVGMTLQPPRFILPFLILAILLCFMLAQDMLRKSHRFYERRLLLVLASIMVVAGLFHSFVQNRDFIPRYFSSKKMGLDAWYADDGKYAFSMTCAMRDGGWLKKKVLYVSPLPTGLMSMDEIPEALTDLWCARAQNRFEEYSPAFDYVLCSERERVRYGLQDLPVVLKRGFLVLLKR